MNEIPVKIREVQGVIVIELPEILDYPTIYRMRDTITEQIESQKNRILLDFAKVKELNSTGLGIIISRLRRARESGGDIKVMNPSEEIMNLMEIMGADKIFDIVNSVEQAVSLFKSQIE